MGTSHMLQLESHHLEVIRNANLSVLLPETQGVLHTSASKFLWTSAWVLMTLDRCTALWVPMFS